VRIWTDDRIKEAILVLKQSVSGPEAAKKLSASWGFPVTVSMIDKAFRRHGIGPYGTYISTGANSPEQALQQNSIISTVSNLLQVLSTSKDVKTIKELASILGVSQKKIREAIKVAKTAGHSIHVSHDNVSLETLPQERPVRVQTALDGDWHIIGVMSDLHVGSVHCMEEEIVAFVHKAYDYGVRDIMIPGDLFEGNLRHHGFQFELKCLGYDEQAALFLSILPRLDGLTYHYCDGNHEFNSWFRTIGMQPGKALQRDALAIGRDDLHYLGPITGRVLLGDGDPDSDIKIELSHTGDRKAYAISYPVQKHIENIPIGAKPHLLLKAHLHQYSKIDVRGVVAIQTGCFKGRGYFEEDKNIHPQIGGIIIWMRRKGRYFDIRDQWCAVRPKPLIWANISSS